MPSPVSASFINLGASTLRQSAGTSTSGTPGTAVATVTASAGNQLVFFSIFTTQSNTANTQHTLTITYSDTTTTAETTAAASAAFMLADYGGIARYAAGAFAAVTALSAKRVTSIAVTTTGVGTGTRGAAIAAWEISQ